MRMPNYAKCDCGETIDLDRSVECGRCKSHYCGECRKEGEVCVNCMKPSKKEQTAEEMMDDFKLLLNNKYNGLKPGSNTNKTRYNIYAVVDDMIEAAEARGQAKATTQAAKIVEEMMEDEEHWQPIARRILELSQTQDE